MKYSKEYRLSRKADIQSVFSHPTKVTYKYLLALYSANSLNHPRLGIMLSKSRLPKAVDRNCLKRIIRESFRASLSDLPAVDILVMLRGKWVKDSLRLDVDNVLNLIKTSGGAKHGLRVQK